MEFVVNSKGNRQVVLDGYVYNKQKMLANNTISWDCIERRNKKACRARIKTVNDQLVGRVNGHDGHPPKPESVRAAKVRAEMKERARTTVEKTRDIISGGAAAENDAVLANLPSARTLQRDIQRQRQKANIHAQVPNNNDFAFIIPQEYCLTTTGQQFLQVDSHLGGRMLMFGSQESIDFLRNSPDWFMDGTFDTVPPQFLQLYTVHGYNRGRNAVGIYALLQNKTEATYERMMNHVNFLTGGVVPNSINIDFERAAINAVETVYPNTSKYGCFFHLSKNIYKKVQENGLAPLYLNDQVFRTNIRMVCALAFVPVADIERCFDILCLQCGRNEVPILDYFETTYVGVLRRGVRRPPIYEHALWNVYDRVVNNLPRTTNAVEGWHNAFARSVGQSHANIWTFINMLKREHVHVHLSITQHQAGFAPPAPKRKYVDVNNRINTIVTTYANVLTIDYLRAISYNIL